MSHIIGRGRYARETYPQARPPGGAGCVLGVGADSNEKSISVVSTVDEFFLFPRQQNVQGNPVEVVLPASFALGDALLIRQYIEWSYDQNAVTPSSALAVSAAVVDLGSGYEFVLQGLGFVPYSSSARIIRDDGTGGEQALIAATEGSILFTPAAFSAPPRVAIACETEVPVDLSVPNLNVAEESGPAFLDVTHIKAGCVFQEPAFTLSGPIPLENVPFTPQQ